jgi:trigger factor
MCTFCLTVSSVAPVTVRAEETEAVTEAAEETEAVSEADETEAETEAEVIERPTYTASDYVTLGEYKGLTVVKGSTEVTEDEIDEEAAYYISLADAQETLTEGTVQDGDTANIDYEGKLDGEAFDGGTAKGYDLEIGSGTFIDGFEEGLIGVEVGETVDLPLTFPENYGSEDLAGQDVIFTVTVNEIKRTPELSDELVSTITDGEYSDVESYRESLRAELEANKESTQESQMKSDLLTQIAASSTIEDYPQEMLDYGLSNMVSTYKSYAEMYSMEFEDFLSTYFGMTEDEFEEEALLAVQESLKQEMYLKAIAEAESMEVSEEEFATESQNFADQYGYDSAEDLISQYGEETVRISILQNKVLDFLLENAVITEEAETEAETETAEEAAAEEETEADAEVETEADTEAVTEAETEAETEA